MFEKWWESYPERLKHELDELKKANIEFKQHTIHDKDSELLAIDFRFPVRGETFDFRAIFPDFYPYFRFEVYAEKLSLGRHQNPFDRNLCLLGRASENWHTSDTLASFIVKRIPQLIDAVDSKTLDEEPQGEPYSDYFRYDQYSTIHIESDWVFTEDQNCGDFTFKLCERSQGGHHGIVTSLSAGSERIEFKNKNFTEIFGEKEYRGKWFRLQDPPRVDNPSVLLKEVLAQYKAKPVINYLNNRRLPSQKRFSVCAVIFPEEVRQHEHSEGWLFIFTEEGLRGQTSTFIRASRSSQSDFSSRVPETQLLQDSTIAVFGCGALGATSIIHLARNATGNLKCVDYDFVQTGNTVRWALGMDYAGLGKSEAIGDFVKRNYPYTCAEACNFKLGGALNREQMRHVVRDVSVIYDATAEVGIQYFLSQTARNIGVPYVCVSATEGAWGGVVFSETQDLDSGCWFCLQCLLNERPDILPPAKEADKFQPLGCADPTFTGSSFDLDHIAIAGVRRVASILCSQDRRGYPLTKSPLEVISLRKNQGMTVHPEHIFYDIPIHSECPHHA